MQLSCWKEERRLGVYGCVWRVEVVEGLEVEWRRRRPKNWLDELLVESRSLRLSDINLERTEDVPDWAWRLGRQLVELNE